MIEFKERGRGTKWHHRTPRARINRLGGDRVASKRLTGSRITGKMTGLNGHLMVLKDSLRPTLADL